jgi:hypothetical protein
MQRPGILLCIILLCSGATLAQQTDTTTKAIPKKTLGQHIDSATNYIKRNSGTVKKSISETAARVSEEIDHAAQSIKKGAQTAGKELKDAAQKTRLSMKDSSRQATQQPVSSGDHDE